MVSHDFYHRQPIRKSQQATNISPISQPGNHPKTTRTTRKNLPRTANKIVQAVAQVRNLIQGLTAAELGVDQPTLAQIQAHYFSRLNTLTPYYTQMANLDLLYSETTVKDKKGTVTVKKQKEAWERTCNVTSMAMTLEGLGVKIEDFKGNAALMERIAGHYDIKDVTQLRLPDFLQLVAIYLSFKGKPSSAEVANLGPDDFSEKVLRLARPPSVWCYSVDVSTSSLPCLGSRPRLLLTHWKSR